MKKYILPLICICIIAFSMISCAKCPSCESVPLYPRNYLLIGIYHSLILPFSVIGKILDFDIGIYSTSKSHFTYWIGFFLGLLAYAKGFMIFGEVTKDRK